jgi:hypothetical protein
MQANLDETTQPYHAETNPLQGRTPLPGYGPHKASTPFSNRLLLSFVAMNEEKVAIVDIFNRLQLFAITDSDRKVSLIDGLCENG